MYRHRTLFTDPDSIHKRKIFWPHSEDNMVTKSVGAGVMNRPVLLCPEYNILLYVLNMGHPLYFLCGPLRDELSVFFFNSCLKMFFRAGSSPLGFPRSGNNSPQSGRRQGGSPHLYQTEGGLLQPLPDRRWVTSTSSRQKVG